MAMGQDGSGPPLHEFMASNRDRILALALEKMRARSPQDGDEALAEGTPEVFDEIVKGLRLRAGVPAPAPDYWTAGVRAGRSRRGRRQRIGLVAYGIGAISDSLGELGGEQGLRFAANEYQHFNQGIDEATAAAIEEYERQERASLDLEHSKRLGFLAHEIRNSLSSASMAYATLKKGAMGINSRTGDLLGRSLKSIDLLIQQALAAIQLEAGAPIERRSLHLATIARQLEASAVIERGVTVQLELAEGPMVHADERLLRAAGSNLLQNAIKFTRDAGLVTVRTRQENEQVVLEVEDECGGLPPGTQESLFSPFRQFGDDRRGLGLGLAIVREAADASGGRLEIVNLPGKGCVFRLMLPAARN
jgi:signal transduction histidine kinase